MPKVYTQITPKIEPIYTLRHPYRPQVLKSVLLRRPLKALLRARLIAAQEKAGEGNRTPIISLEG